MRQHWTLQQHKTTLALHCVAEGQKMGGNAVHEFKSQLGKTFNEVLTEYRMQKAQELLIKGDMRVGEVAYAVGYPAKGVCGQKLHPGFESPPHRHLHP